MANFYRVGILLKSTAVVGIGFLLTACSGAEPAPTKTSSPILPTETTASTPTLTPPPSPTATPEPYKIEDGQLFVFDEQAGGYEMIFEGVSEIIEDDKGEVFALDVEGKRLLVLEDGVWKEFDAASVWRFVAPAENSGGVEIAKIIEEFLSNPDNLPKNDQVDRLSSADGELEFGRIEELTDSRELYDLRSYAFLFGKVVPLDIAGEIPGSAILLVLLPDDSNNIEAGGQVIPIFLNSDVQSGKSLRSVKDGGVKFNNFGWDYDDNYPEGMTDLEFATYFVNNQDKMFGKQFVCALKIGKTSETLNSFVGANGVLSGRNNDNNEDGVWDGTYDGPGGGNFEIVNGIPVVFPHDTFSP